jgi:hypothetical protein
MKKTHGLFPDVVEGIWAGVDNLALDLVGPAGIVPQTANASTDVSFGHGNGLSIIQRLASGEFVEILLEEVGELVEQLPALLRCHLFPFAIESLACGRNSNVDILLGGLLHRADDRLVGGVDDFEGLSVDGLDPFTVDEAIIQHG